jgi:hypothetical protein
MLSQTTILYPGVLNFSSKDHQEALKLGKVQDGSLSCKSCSVSSAGNTPDLILLNLFVFRMKSKLIEVVGKIDPHFIEMVKIQPLFTLNVFNHAAPHWLGIIQLAGFNPKANNEGMGNVSHSSHGTPLDFSFRTRLAGCI